MSDTIQKAERLDETKVEGGEDPETQACSFSLLPDWSDPIATGPSSGARWPWMKTMVPNQFFLP